MIKNSEYINISIERGRNKHKKIYSNIIVTFLNEKFRRIYFQVSTYSYPLNTKIKTQASLHIQHTYEHTYSQTVIHETRKQFFFSKISP
jgi:hypothetical protein